jgi:hypothetical protein
MSEFDPEIFEADNGFSIDMQNFARNAADELVDRIESDYRDNGKLSQPDEDSSGTAESIRWHLGELASLAVQLNRHQHFLVGLLEQFESINLEDGLSLGRRKPAEWVVYLDGKWIGLHRVPFEFREAEKHATVADALKWIRTHLDEIEEAKKQRK